MGYWRCCANVYSGWWFIIIFEQKNRIVKPSQMTTNELSHEVSRKKFSCPSFVGNQFINCQWVNILSGTIMGYTILNISIGFDDIYDVIIDDSECFVQWIPFFRSAVEPIEHQNEHNWCQLFQSRVGINSFIFIKNLSRTHSSFKSSVESETIVINMFRLLSVLYF